MQLPVSKICFYCWEVCYGGFEGNSVQNNKMVCLILSNFTAHFQNLCVASLEKGIMVVLYVILFICR